MLAYTFNFPKTFQAAVVLLKQHNGRMESARLLKLLYIADRELLAEIGRTLTGDEPAAMQRGPVLRTVQKLIAHAEGTPDLEEWSATIRKDGHTLYLQGDAGVGRLNKAELRKLEEVAQRFWETDSDDLSDVTHAFGEWRAAFEPGHTPDAAFPIEWEAALVAQGKGNLVEAVRAAQHERELTEAAFRG
jgi:uncharacterized phage-associated protein